MNKQLSHKQKRKRKFYVTFASIMLLLLFMYSYSPYKFEFAGHYHKIWAHRVNSVEKLHSALNYFVGVELDLVYYETDDYFDINHAPAKSIDLRFDNYMDALKEKEQPYFWLDMKNLNIDNSEKILAKLKLIFKKKNYAFNKVLIETRHPEALPIFTEAGFKTSYYLPYFLTDKDKDEFENDIKKIKAILSEQPRIAISSSYKDYDIMTKYFPDRPKYIWALVFTINKDFLLTRKILKDTTVKAVLVPYKSITGNR